jgi:molybdate transport system regulatory protein
VAAELKLKAQILVDGEIALGPGKADLLHAIEAHGSISAAARAMGLSYRRAWLMVDAMNRLFADPLVETVRGGPGGASLSVAGTAVLADFRALQQALDTAGRTGAPLLAALKTAG